MALNLPKAQLDLGMSAELWSVDSLAVAEKAADAVGLAKSCLRPLGAGCKKSDRQNFYCLLAFVVQMLILCK